MYVPRSTPGRADKLPLVPGPTYFAQSGTMRSINNAKDSKLLRQRRGSGNSLPKELVAFMLLSTLDSSHAQWT